jgi:hypothetical protein
MLIKRMIAGSCFYRPHLSAIMNDMIMLRQSSPDLSHDTKSTLKKNHDYQVARAMKPTTHSVWSWILSWMITKFAASRKKFLHSPQRFEFVHYMT